jgi:hypothetical protein
MVKGNFVFAGCFASFCCFQGSGKRAASPLDVGSYHNTPQTSRTYNIIISNENNLKLNAIDSFKGLLLLRGQVVNSATGKSYH